MTALEGTYWGLQKILDKAFKYQLHIERAKRKGHKAPKAEAEYNRLMKDASDVRIRLNHLDPIPA